MLGLICIVVDRWWCASTRRGLTPKLRESDLTSHRESITKQGSRLVRWSAVEAVSRYHGGPPIRASYQRIAERRGINIGRVAAARKLFTLAY